jgi:DNA-binding HxlR family transcriptional regulator
MSRKNTGLITECPVTYAISMIGGKWHLPIIWALSKSHVLRYNELKKRLCCITNMMLSQSLKELEGYGLIERTQFPEIPPRVEYSLTQAGLALMPAINELAEWGAGQMAVRREQPAAEQAE